ncbi:putative Ig domain-containing protein [Glaciecola petra]|uniref:Ig domain-containing protein n=1 Tax=Glaciecola petra TaxID=3075602 RepID=A0ABU2ZNX1_9ALTE|nr:putative Ig domain-containing protein [Aestuariibacter sp. P117]MDT0594095.1 putative Ig domain-containing protein [Aestuariibacter sp. P117]
MNKNYKRSVKHLAIAVGSVLAISACGGGSSNEDTSTPPVVTPPVNNAPVISSTALTDATEGQAYTYTLTGTDADSGDTLTLAAPTLPAWLNFDASSGILSGTPGENDIGSASVSLTISDGTETVTQSFTITVAAAPNEMPVVTSTAILVAEENVAYSYTIMATDADNDTLTFAATTLPSWMSFEASTGILSGTPAVGDVGNSDVVLTVNDGTDTVSQTFTIVVSPAPFVNTAPVITSNGLTMAMVNTAYTYTITATDSDNDTLTFSSVSLPAWGVFDTTTGVLSGTPDIAGDYPVELAVSDGTDSVSQNFTITATAASANVALSIFDNVELPNWATWTCCGVTQATVVTDDADKDQVVEFTIDRAENQGGTVVGFTARDGDGATNGMPFDASAFRNTGTLVFDLKLVTQSSGGPQDWFLKVESGAGQEVQLGLSSAQEGHSAPVLDTWQTYTFDLSSLTGSLDLSAIDLVMIFPAFSANSDGTVFRVDNVRIMEDGATPAPPPNPGGTPTDLALTLFDDEILAEWAAWTCCGVTQASLVTDEDSEQGQVTEFTIDRAENQGGTVVGYTARDGDGAVNGMPFDASAFASTGVIQFDLKLVTQSSGGPQEWFLKVESGAGQEVQVALSSAQEAHAAPVLDTWQTYTFNLADLQGSLDKGAIDLVMIFPAFSPNSDGTVFRIDNLKIFRDGASSTNPTPPPSGNGPVTLDFEADGAGNAGYTWKVFENDSDPDLEIVANENPDSVNGSAMVAKFTALQTGNPFAGTETDSGPTFTLDNSNKIVRIAVYKTVISDVGIKFSVGEAAQPELKVANTKINEWEVLTFDFSSYIGRAETIGITNVIVFPDFNARSQDNIVFFDNITFSEN